MRLAALCRERTALTEADIQLLEHYEGTLEAIANLTQGDVFIDCLDRAGRVFVAAQAAPGGLRSNYKTWVHGQYALPVDEPAVHRAFAEGLPFHDIVASTQEHKTVRQDVTPLHGAGGAVIGALIAEHDVSRELAMERKLEALGGQWRQGADQAEATDALREVHHRVKNHLQILTSCCSLQARSLPEGEARLQLQKMTGMIRAVASLQGTLAELRQPGDRPVALRPLLEQLLRDFDAMVGQGGQIVFHLDCAPMQLPPDTVFHLLITVNELLSNALKHGLPTHRGAITVEVRRGNRFGTVCVTDTGGGLAPDAAQGLGLTILRALVTEQMRGEFHIRSDREGTKAVFSFVLA